MKVKYIKKYNARYHPYKEAFENYTLEQSILLFYSYVNKDI